MPLGWNEIRQNAISFSKEFAGETREHAEAKTFWDGFFRVFGLNRRHIASFEEPVKNLSGNYAFIDLFWKGTLLVEHKSAGKDLSKAASQAYDYIQLLLSKGRGDEVPRFIVISDFARIELHDLEAGTTYAFPLTELHKHVNKFGFIPGYEQRNLAPEDPINIRAVQIMGDLHDALEEGGYTGHDLERLLVRVLFCLFAEDTGIFERSAFQLYLENHTREDGSDLGAALTQYFSVLNTPQERRQSNLQEELAQLPYVNGELFTEFLGFPAFNRGMRDRLLACTKFDWSQISPAVFGALFQSVMEPKERRQVGAHYTSERDILKVIEPLFLDELREELEKAGKDRRKLKDLHDRIATMRLLDPACGCGNFLVVSYRELRLIELEIIKRVEKDQKTFDIGSLARVDVDQLHGIEIDEWPARIAEVAMWLMDHQMNIRLSVQFGEYFVRLPLKKSPRIHLGDALTVEWDSLLPASECSYVMGNPPFIGKKEQTPAQKAQVKSVWQGVSGAGNLDYVTCWYRKSLRYISGTKAKVAFVSTNSIAQGEQVGIFWSGLLATGTVSVHFAHRTFAWQSEARGKAHVHVVIIGFAAFDAPGKTIYEYEHPRANPHAIAARHINGYLADAPDVIILSRTRSITGAKTLHYGSMMIDKGRRAGEDEGLIITEESREELLEECPALAPYIRKIVGGEEFIAGSWRWCLWLEDAPPEVFRKSRKLRERIEKVRKFRISSDRLQTKKLAETPALFGERRQPERSYLLIPKVSSMSRNYIPIGFVDPAIIASGSALIIPDATLYEFGVLGSAMHNGWMRYVAGRMKSDYQYSKKIVYNNFPWPQNVDETKRVAVELASQGVLDAREAFPESTLADLYDPLAMPPALVKAHAKLDRAVDRCYRSQPFVHERNRVEHLFKLYDTINTPLTAKAKRKAKS